MSSGPQTAVRGLRGKRLEKKLNEKKKHFKHFNASTFYLVEMIPAGGEGEIQIFSPQSYLFMCSVDILERKGQNLIKHWTFANLIYSYLGVYGSETFTRPTQLITSRCSAPHCYPDSFDEHQLLFLFIYFCFQLNNHHHHHRIPPFLETLFRLT